MVLVRADTCNYLGRVFVVILTAER